MTRPQTPRRRPRTEFRVPPPLLQRIDAVGFPGADVLAEGWSDPYAALVFWQCFRDVELWGKTADREGLFHPASADVRERGIEALDPTVFGNIKPRLTGFVELLRDPDRARAEDVAALCTGVSEWFEERGRLRCAADFAVAAFLANSQRAGLAVRVARLTRLLAEYPRSISWFDYSLYLARRSGDWQAYAEALAGLGNLNLQRGNYPRARHYHRRCLRVASRKHLQEMIGSAYHGLFNVEVECGNPGMAQVFAEKALQTYPPGSHRLLRLARDLAYHWTTWGHGDQALPVAVEMVVHHFERPADRAQIWSGAARAAGSAGAVAMFEDAWIETWNLVRQGVADPFAADVLIDLARGAAALGDTRRAEYAARTALDVAAARGQSSAVAEARALLDDLHAVVARPLPAPGPAVPEPRPTVSRILRALQQMRSAME